MFNNEVIDIGLYIHIYTFICTLLYGNFKINAQVYMYSPTDLNIGYCVELTFLEGKLGRFFC